MDDVARLAGVSAATVSRCLNSPEKVRAEIRGKVEAAILQLGFVPHSAARALASQRSRTIGAVVPTVDNAIFARCIQGLHARLDQRGHTLLLACSEYDPECELRQVSTLLARGVDGLLLIGVARDPRVYERLKAKHVPYVTTWVHDDGQEHPCIGFDNRAAAARVADYLMDLGHRDIAMIAGLTVHNDRAAQRVEGVRAALAGRSIGLPEERLLLRPYEIGEGRRAMRRLLGAARPPTAVICGNDVLALGALFEAAAQGTKVPDQVSITGFDDLELASQAWPSLTTIRVPSTIIGELAADWLLDRLAGRPADAATLVEVDLVVRDSTARPRARTA